MAKETNKPEKKKRTGKTMTPPPAAPETHVSTEAPTTVFDLSKVDFSKMVNQTGKGLSADGKVELLKLADDIFRKDPNAAKRFTLETIESMNSIVAAGVITSIVDEAMFGEGTFKVVLANKMYPQLVLAAHDLGIKLPDIKALPGAKTVEVSTEQIEVSEETRAQMQAEHDVQTAGEAGQIELDPAKVAEIEDETARNEAVKKALNFHLITGPKHSNPKEALVNCVDFMYNYTQAITTDLDQKDKLNDRTMFEWLNEVFEICEPTVLMRGIGKGMISQIENEGNVVSAFLILRAALTEFETGKVNWDDQSIADAVKAIVLWSCKSEIAKNEAALAALDKKNKNYKTVKESYDKEIARYKAISAIVLSPNYDLVAELIAKADEGNKTYTGICGRIIRAYYTPGAEIKPRSGYKNINYNIEQHAGIIINMFNASGDRNSNYDEANLTELVQYTEEELLAKRKEEMEKLKSEKKD